MNKINDNDEINIHLKTFIRLIKSNVKIYDLFKKIIKKTYNTNITNVTQIKSFKSFYDIIVWFERLMLTIYYNNITYEQIINIIDNIENLYLKQKYNKTKLDVFNQFLYDNDIYDAYWEYRTKLLPCSSIIMNNKSKLTKMLNDAFPWKETKEGFEFWNLKNYKLQENIKNL